MELLIKRNRVEFELNIRNDDLKQKLRNLQDSMLEYKHSVVRFLLNDAKDNIIENQKNKIICQNRNISRLGDVLIKLTHDTSDIEGKSKVLTERYIEMSNEVERIKYESFESKKKLDLANS